MRAGATVFLFAINLGVYGARAGAELPETAVGRVGDQVISASGLVQHILEVHGDTPLRYLLEYGESQEIRRTAVRMICYPEIAEVSGAVLEAADPALAVTLRTVRARLLIDEFIRSQAPVLTDAALRELYEEETELGRIGERIGLRHMFWQVAESEPEASWQVAEASAAKARERVLAGALFQEVAREVMPVEDHMTHLPGEVTYPNPARFNPDLKKVCLAMEPGAVSPPVRSRHGVHLLQLVEYKPESRSTFEETKDLLRRHLTSRNYRATRETLRTRAAESIPVRPLPGLNAGAAAQVFAPALAVGSREYSLADLRAAQTSAGYPVVLEEEAGGVAMPDLYAEGILWLQLLELAEASSVEGAPRFQSRWRSHRSDLIGHNWLEQKAAASLADPGETVLLEWYNAPENRRKFQLPTLRSGWELILDWGAGLDAPHPEVYRARTETHALALRIKDEIEQGLPFEEAVARYSTRENNRATGGRLALLDLHRNSRFDNVAASLQEGEVSDPVGIGHSWALYKVDKVFPGERAPFAEARDDVLRDWRAQQVVQARNRYLDAMARNRGFEFADDDEMLKRLEDAAQTFFQ